MGRLVQGLHPLALYAVPASAVAMTLAVVFSLGTGFVGAMLLAATGAIQGAGLGPALYVLLGGLAGAIIMVRVARLKAFVWAGVILSLLNASLALSQVLAGTTDTRDLALAAGLGVAQALVATGLAALGILAVGTLFGVATPFHSYELMRARTIPCCASCRCRPPAPTSIRWSWPTWWKRPPRPSAPTRCWYGPELTPTTWARRCGRPSSSRTSWAAARRMRAWPRKTARASSWTMYRTGIALAKETPRARPPVGLRARAPWHHADGILLPPGPGGRAQGRGR